ncbi:MAG: S46 family peptidase [Bacteroidales bacterium]|nr:S46 family peptidase [Bacteroidales bacterium]
MRKLFISLLFAVLPLAMMADEGMWIPMLLQKNEADMQKAGMRITAKDIYDINHACLKDAVILFNQGCTGEFVSDQGLFLTNHHCGYYYITSNSTVEHDYLTHGFWAMSREQEIPCRGLTATRLVRMEDVTAQVLEGVTDPMSEKDRAAIISKNIERISAKAVEGSHYKAVIKPFYYGNQYFMYINEVFTDVRLVGAPPSNIGKFGGDTDNWIWPRHTGDFSMFRVYCAPDGKPAAFSSDNVPYKPLKHLTVSLKGLNEDDFTFVFGYPGSTQRYVTSDAMRISAIEVNPIRIALRDIRLKYYKDAMEQSPAQRLKYASKVAGIANGWKKWQGETLGIERLQGVAKKEAFERQFQRWANDKPEYRDVLPRLHQAYATLHPITIERTYFDEAVRSSDLMQRAGLMYTLLYGATSDSAKHVWAGNFAKQQDKYFSDFDKHGPIDKGIFVDTYILMWKAGYAPYLGKEESAVRKKLETAFDKSILTNKDRLVKLLSDYTPKQGKKLENDPAVALFSEAYSYVYHKDNKLQIHDSIAYHVIPALMRTYVKGIMEKDPDVNYFPDANLTLRVAYGAVKGFKPKDATYYVPYSTLAGIMEKENPDIYDYVVEPRLKELYRNKDYGRYADRNGDMPVCFLTTCHTTGGNSGSPVLNADGQLVGVNFDRCWEGTMSDLLFDPNYCRNICLDIRYCLFIIDKFAGARHLVDEMTIVQ